MAMVSRLKYIRKIYGGLSISDDLTNDIDIVSAHINVEEFSVKVMREEQIWRDALIRDGLAIIKEFTFHSTFFQFRKEAIHQEGGEFLEIIKLAAVSR
ncbi:hypothetical protein BNJ_00090 [Kaumoebavirus]|uniref:hypothetical protein n=1 Tax=Kaumoebavirus TaxID=1859492 RepID=UPI0009C35C6B|nr:hypothetical protein BNJ_00090 [Kaumoebavirus]ARA71930.1 hypothetical protein BNJ_00090 [Kaumoebavirus]